MSIPTVSIIVPCRNEQDYIEAAIKSMLAQDDVDGGFEIVVADGMSNDATHRLLDTLVARDPRLRVIDNPGRIVSSGLNAAIRAARGEVIVRMDAHTEYAGDYVRQCVEVLRRSGADNVGGPWNAKGRTYLQTAIALAFQSPFSSGGAGSHRLDYEGEVDSVYLGCWKRDCLVRLGLFDEDLVRNQDDELNLRLVRSGGRIWQSPSIRSWYFPRGSLSSLFRQYQQYGYWKVRVIQKHHMPAAIRHLIPGGFVASLLILAALGPFVSMASSLFIALATLYGGGAIAASIVTCSSHRNWRYVPVMPLVFWCYHFGYGWGFLRGFLDFIVLRRGGTEFFKQLTRGK